MVALDADRIKNSFMLSVGISSYRSVHAGSLESTKEAKEV